MRTVIVHQPCIISVADDASLKQEVIRQNSLILRGGWPANVPFLGGAKDLIGNPNYFLSESICEMLLAEGILTRTELLDENRKQRKITLNKKEEVLWNYSWAEGSLESLSEENLQALAWDLRSHQNFCHISLVSEDSHTRSDSLVAAVQDGLTDLDENGIVKDEELDDSESELDDCSDVDDWTKF